MEGFGKFWDANAMMIGIVFTVLAIGVAVALNHGTIAAVLGLVAGLGFMWVGKPVHAEDQAEEA